MTRTWWGRTTLERGQCGRWRIGSLSLWAWCLEHEWRIATLHSDDPLEDGVELEIPCAGGFSPPPEAELRRFATAPDGDTLELTARLADRATVARPESPFVVLAGDQTTVFLATPLWIVVRTGTGKTMLEVPTYRPSDTWFGPNTRTGELCYAVSASVRLSLGQVVRRPGRALTSLIIRNECDGPLAVERVKVPSPALSLGRTEDGTFWTDPVLVRREQGAPTAKVTVTSPEPELAGKLTAIADPRSSGPTSKLVRALGTLLS